MDLAELTHHSCFLVPSALTLAFALGQLYIIVIFLLERLKRTKTKRQRERGRKLFRSSTEVPIKLNKHKLEQQLDILLTVRQQNNTFSLQKLSFLDSKVKNKFK